LMVRLRMLLVAERLTDGKIVTISDFNGLIDLTQVQPRRGSSSRSSGGSTHHRRTEQDNVNKKMEHRLRENEEYNLQIQEYYRQ
jgi:hypothetical protein